MGGKGLLEGTWQGRHVRQHSGRRAKAHTLLGAHEALPFQFLSKSKGKMTITILNKCSNEYLCNVPCTVSYIIIHSMLHMTSCGGRTGGRRSQCPSSSEGFVRIMFVFIPLSYKIHCAICFMEKGPVASAWAPLVSTATASPRFPVSAVSCCHSPIVVPSSPPTRGRPGPRQLGARAFPNSDTLWR